MTSAVPELHSKFLERIHEAVVGDARFNALLAGGSFIHNGLDEHSDLDLVLIAEDASYTEVMSIRMAFAKALGGLVCAFSGEHVGEPRVLICLYGPPLLHVDLKFVIATDLDHRIERPIVLFARDSVSVLTRLDRAHIAWPNVTPDWFEARAWIWLHYAATKLARGELYEALGMLSFFREQVLGPLLHRRAGLPQREVRHVEMQGLDWMGLLTSTVATHDSASIKAALLGAINAYMNLRADCPPSVPADAMPEALLAVID